MAPHTRSRLSPNITDSIAANITVPKSAKPISSASAQPGLLASAVKLLLAEEDFRSKPYLCSQGYPTVGVGQRIGPKGAGLELYQFTLPKAVAIAWLEANVSSIIEQLSQHPEITAAFANCNLARQTVLVSMAYQMGVSGLAGFEQTLSSLAGGLWFDAKLHALDSHWARIQSRNRALRHAMTLATGES
jgi:lysozyme